MSVIAEAILATFDPDSALVWTAEGADHVAARFAVAMMQVETHFIQTAPGEWHVGFDATSEASAIDNLLHPRVQRSPPSRAGVR